MFSIVLSTVNGIDYDGSGVGFWLNKHAEGKDGVMWVLKLWTVVATESLSQIVLRFVGDIPIIFRIAVPPSLTLVFLCYALIASDM